MAFRPKRIVLFMMLALGFLYGNSFAGERDKISDVMIPEGMQTIKIGDSYVIVPKNGRVRQQDNRYFIETADEYAARKFEQVEKRIGDIEERQCLLEEEVAKLKKE